MFKYLLTVIVGFVMVAFQNCAPTTKGLSTAASSGADSTGSTSSESSAVQYNKLRTDVFQTLVVLQDPVTLNSLDVDLSSGRIQQMDQEGHDTGVLRCLGSEDLERLKAILNDAEVCEPVQKNVSANKFCTQIYEFPYAGLANSNTQVNLGEKKSGCDIPIDLCGEKAKLLKAFVDQLLLKMDQLTCP